MTLDKPIDPLMEDEVERMIHSAAAEKREPFIAKCERANAFNSLLPKSHRLIGGYTEANIEGFEDMNTWVREKQAFDAVEGTYTEDSAEWKCFQTLKTAVVRWHEMNGIVWETQISNRPNGVLTVI